jgi:hypothetical protein
MDGSWAVFLQIISSSAILLTETILVSKPPAFVQGSWPVLNRGLTLGANQSLNPGNFDAIESIHW